VNRIVSETEWWTSRSEVLQPSALAAVCTIECTVRVTQYGHDADMLKIYENMSVPLHFI